MASVASQLDPILKVVGYFVTLKNSVLAWRLAFNHAATILSVRLFRPREQEN